MKYIYILLMILVVLFCFEQYHDVMLRLCGGGHWELTKLETR